MNSNYCYAEKQDDFDEYTLHFWAVGKLKEVFEEYDLALQLECRFSNDKGKGGCPIFCVSDG